MKKIFVSILLVLSAAVFITCERNELYYKTQDDSLLSLIPGTENPPAPPAAIYIYNAGLHDGNLVSRSNADAICASGQPAGTTTYHAFLSFSTSYIRDLVPPIYQSLPVIHDDGAGTINVISSTWTALWITPFITVTLSSAGVIPVSSYWWSGSQSNGSVDTFPTANCADWTSNSSTDQGVTGYANFTGSSWIVTGRPYCNNPNYVLCVAY